MQAIFTMSSELSDVHVNLQDFCDRHAKAAATDLVTAFCSYRNFRSTATCISYTEFAKKFADRFIAHFENEFLKRNPVNAAQTDSGISQTTNSIEELSDVSENEVEDQSPRFSQKPFFRRLSFKGLRKGRNFFRKQDSDDTETPTSEKKNDKQNKSKLAKITVECRRNGLASYLVADNMDGPPKWEKCRLSLTSSAGGGYILVFYCPPKATKPKCGVFCHLITEVRETTALEMPDKENTFVVRAAYNAEYVIEAQSLEDRRDWVATLKYCMRESRAIVDGADRVSLGTLNEEPGLLRSMTMCNKPSTAESDIPDLPPRPPGAKVDSAAGTRSDLHSSRMDMDNGFDAEQDLSMELRDYPWFHGTLVRSEATTLVQHSGERGHGVFLVRQSETRKGEFVLTFNFHGRAKHLRLLLNELKQCCVQHLWFPTIFDALEHFRQNSIPLENGGIGDVKLTEYIINSPAHMQASLLMQRTNNGPIDHRHPIPIPPPREVPESADDRAKMNSCLTDVRGLLEGKEIPEQIKMRNKDLTCHYGLESRHFESFELPSGCQQNDTFYAKIVKFNGPVRVKTEYLELHESVLSSSPVASPSNTTGASSSGTNSRAVANTYSFI